MLGQLFVTALIAWGIFKCVTVANRPFVNAKCAYSLAIFLAALCIHSLWTWNFIATGTPDLFLLYVNATLSFFLLPATAIVLAVLGLREIKQQRTPGEFDPTRGRGMAIWALILSSLMLLPGLAIAVRLGATRLA